MTCQFLDLIVELKRIKEVDEIEVILGVAAKHVLNKVDQGIIEIINSVSFKDTRVREDQDQEIGLVLRHLDRE